MGGWCCERGYPVCGVRCGCRTPAVDAGVLAAGAAAVRHWAKRQPDRGTLLACYEAEPTGFGLQRQSAVLGLACQVIAPDLGPTRPRLTGAMRTTWQMRGGRRR